MPRNITSTLSGVKNTNLHVLINSGNNSGCGIKLPNEVIRLKSQIMKFIIIPFMSKNWKVLEENLVFFDKIKSKVTTYTSRYHCIDLQLYSDLLEAFETAVFLHMEITTLEKKLYGSDCNMSTLLFKTTMVRLKPELELYNLVIGKPKLKLGEKYNSNILSDIQILLEMDNATFEQIKKFITNKYLIK